MVLVDTSAWIFALKEKPFLPLKEKIDLLLGEGLILTFGMIKAALYSKATLLHADIHFNLMAKHTELKVESFLSLIQKDY